MKKCKLCIFLLLGFVLMGSAVFSRIGGSESESDSGSSRIIKPVYGTIKASISTTGMIEPQNRLEIKPSLSGRMEEILVSEGDSVEKGSTLAWMSSTERATLLDYARSKGEQEYAYWQDVYKPTPLIAPISGTVIVRGVEPGQTVSASDAVLVLADRLIVKAQVDETDIGKVQKGQKVRITLDAYPDAKATGTVGHIAYESKIISNVTIYEVDIIPETVPDVFRSGMSANVEIAYADRENALLIPQAAVGQDEGGSFVMVARGRDAAPARRSIKTGISDEKNVEVLSGIGPDDNVVINMEPKTLKEEKQKTSPFMPRRH
jgi:membrane fusion protein, macrolide-specific efflux system